MRTQKIALLCAVILTALLCSPQIGAAAARVGGVTVPFYSFTLADGGSGGQSEEESSGQDAEPQNVETQSAAAQPSANRAREESSIYMTGEDLLLYAENSPNEMIFIRSGVTVVFPTAELLALDIPPGGALQIEILRDEPTLNGIYVGFYVDGAVYDIHFTAPYRAYVKIEDADETVRCIDPDGTPVELEYIEESGELMVALYTAGEYVFLLPDTPATRPPSIEGLDGENENETDSDELAGLSGGNMMEPPAVVADDFLLIVVASSILSIIMRIAVKRIIR